MQALPLTWALSLARGHSTLSMFAAPGSLGGLLTTWTGRPPRPSNGNWALVGTSLQTRNTWLLNSYPTGVRSFSALPPGARTEKAARYSSLLSRQSILVENSLLKSHLLVRCWASNSHFPQRIQSHKEGSVFLHHLQHLWTEASQEVRADPRGTSSRPSIVDSYLDRSCKHCI